MGEIFFFSEVVWHLLAVVAACVLPWHGFVEVDAVVISTIPDIFKTAYVKSSNFFIELEK
jgi:hypothetical protein